MSRTEAQKRARQNYDAKAYDQVLFKVRKGKSSEYTEAAAALGIGRMEMLRRAVDEFIARHVGTATEMSAECAAERRADETCNATHERAAEIPAQPAETTESGNVGEGIPIIFNGVEQTAQNQQVSKQVQTIEATCNAAPNRITAADKRLVDAVNALSPESKKALLKFLATLQA